MHDESAHDHMLDCLSVVIVTIFIMEETTN